jgi:hypothetical protein
MRTLWKLAALTAVVTVVGCGSGGPSSPSIDAATETPGDVTVLDDMRSDRVRDIDMGGDRNDGARPDGSTCPVAPTPMGTSRAGAMCKNDMACGAGLRCEESFRDGYCTAECVDDPSQACEAAQCGGNGATCLAFGDGPNAVTFCAAVCTPTARAGMPGSCRAGTVCTGWWYTHASGEPDRTGCEWFCANDSHCPAGMPCNTRTGECGAAASTTLRADGEPCDPTRDPSDGPSRQCRGVCFSETDNDREGICGSLINLAVTSDCPDSPSRIRPIAPANENGRRDNLGLCIYRECSSDADCTAPLRCVAGEDGEPNVCTYGEGIPAPDGGVRDVGGEGAPSDGLTTGDVGADRSEG